MVRSEGDTSRSFVPFEKIDSYYTSRMAMGGHLEYQEGGGFTPESKIWYESFASTHYFFSQRQIHLLDQSGISHQNLIQKVARGALRRYLINVGEDRKCCRLYAYRKEDEPAIIELLKGWARRAGRYILQDNSGSVPMDGLHWSYISKLEKSGFLQMDRNGKPTKASIERYDRLMGTHYLLGLRVQFLASRAGITVSHLRTKVAKKYLKGLLENIGPEDGKGIYVYRKEDEEEIIKKLRSGKKGRRPSENSCRSRRKIIDADIGEHFKKVIDAVDECGLSDPIFEEVIERLKIKKRGVEVKGLSIPSISVDDYKRLRKYLWELRQLEV